jgi:hypothetical protein
MNNKQALCQLYFAAEIQGFLTGKGGKSGVVPEKTRKTTKF